MTSGQSRDSRAFQDITKLIQNFSAVALAASVKEQRCETERAEREKRHTTTASK